MIGGEQGRLRMHCVRAHGGRAVLAAFVVAAAFAPVATANGGKDHGEGGGGNAAAPEQHGGGNGAKSHEQHGGSQGDHGNRGDHGEEQRSHANGNGNGQRAHGDHNGQRAHGDRNGHRSHGNSNGTKPDHAPSQSDEGERHGTGKSHGHEHGDSSKGDKGNHGAAHHKTTICHATGSESNPYVQITISDRALAAHRRHQHGEDIIPAPPGGCPGSAVIAGTTAEAAQHTFAGTTPTATPPAASASDTPAAAGPTAGNTVAGTTESATPAQNEVRGVVASSDDTASDSAVAPAGASTGAGDDGSTGPLPFTGLELALLCLAGVLLAAAGVALRRSAATRA